MPKINRVKLTEARVAAFGSKGRAEAWLMDSEVRGLGVRALSTGKAGYALRYRDARGSDKKMTLGDTKAMKLDDARRVAIQKLSEINSGLDPRADAKARRDAPTVRELGMDALAKLETMGLTEAYVYGCRRYLDLFINTAIGDLPVQDVTHLDLERIIAPLRQKPATATQVKRLMTRMFGMAERWNMRLGNPAHGLEVPEVRPRTRFLSREEIGKLSVALREANDPEQADFVRLVLATGSRPQELFKARVEDVDLTRGIWTKPAQTVKQRRLQQVELSTVALEIFARRIDPVRSPWVFPSPNDPTTHRTTVKRFWAAVREQAGIADSDLYDLRKTFATMLLASGVDLATVMKATGHSQASVLLKNYAFAIPNRQREAVNALWSQAGMPKLLPE